MNTTRHHRGGFTLPEIIIVVAISSIVLAALLAAIVALVRGLHPQQVRIDGEDLPIAPSFAAFPSAVRVHQVLADHLTSARATYVFGGTHLTLDSSAAPTQLAALTANALPAIADFSAGLPMDAHGFYERYAAALGPTEAQNTAGNFSVIVLGSQTDRLAATCLVQVRRRTSVVSDGSASVSYVVNDVRLWDVDGTVLRYAFAERELQSASTFVGVVHTWARYAAGRVAEEGPACIVFPDPWVYRGARGRPDDIPSFSRFSYFAGVSP